MNKTKANVYSYKYIDKDIKFLPMHHLGKPQFYDDTKNKVTSFKNDDYVVYYELISTKVDLDSLQKDLLRRKYRKLKGFSGTYKDVMKDSPILKKYVQQPSYKDLGITESDIRADITALQFINEWEKQNGIIKLDSIDLNTPFDKEYNNKLSYSKKQWNNVAINYRNQYLIDLIKKNNDKKVLIIYGDGHRKNFKKQLKTNK